MKKMKNVRNKMLAALVIAASMTSLCAPAYAEEAPAHAEEMYTVTEDEQGAVTIVFNEPIVLSLEESYAEDGVEEDNGIMPYATTSHDEIPKACWGTYFSEDNKYYVSIRGGTDISIRIKYPSYGECYCKGEDITSVFFDSALSTGENFTFMYKCYTQVNESTQNKIINDPAEIRGLYHSGYSTIYFRINSIKLYKA